MTIKKTLGGISASLALIGASQPSFADEIEWQVAPYVWAAAVGLERVERVTSLATVHSGRSV